MGAKSGMYLLHNSPIRSILTDNPFTNSFVDPATFLLSRFSDVILSLSRKLFQISSKQILFFFRIAMLECRGEVDGPIPCHRLASLCPLPFAKYDYLVERVTLQRMETKTLAAAFALMQCCNAFRPTTSLLIQGNPHTHARTNSHKSSTRNIYPPNCDNSSQFIITHYPVCLCM